MHRSLLTSFAVLLYVAATGSFGGETLYKSIGPDGKVDYSDRPPTAGRIEKTMEFNNLPSSEVPGLSTSYVEQLRRFRASQAKTAVPSTPGVVLYAASWCGYCRQARAHLARKGIAYREIDIDTPSGKESFAEIAGGGGVPLLIASGQRVQGYSGQAYESLLAGLNTPNKPSKP